MYFSLNLDNSILKYDIECIFCAFLVLKFDDFNLSMIYERLISHIQTLF